MASYYESRFVQFFMSSNDIHHGLPCEFFQVYEVHLFDCILEEHVIQKPSVLWCCWADAFLSHYAHL